MISRTDEVPSDSGPEEFRLIEGWPYVVSNFGRVRRTVAVKGTRAGVFIRPGWTGRRSNPYFKVTLHDRSRKLQILLHRLVAEAFLGPCPAGQQVDHIDGDTSNNRVTNLRYVSAAVNIRQSVDRGHRGENRHNAVLTEEIVRSARALHELDGTSVSELAALFGFNKATLAHVIARRTWRHVA